LALDNVRARASDAVAGGITDVEARFSPLGAGGDRRQREQTNRQNHQVRAPSEIRTHERTPPLARLIDGIARSMAVIVAVCGQLDADRFDLESTSRAVVLVLAQPDIASAL